MGIGIQGSHKLHRREKSLKTTLQAENLQNANGWQRKRGKQGLHFGSLDMLLVPPRHAGLIDVLGVVKPP